MLKEIFIIGKGALFFHYSADSLKTDDDQAILSSGFLSAIKDFASTTRADVINTFVTENEYFLFEKCGTDKELIGIFERKLPESRAKEFLKRVHALVDKTSIPNESGIVNLATKEKILLKEQIADLVSQFFGAEDVQVHIKELIEKRTGIPLAFLVDADEKKAIASFARPKPLFKESQVKEFLLLLSTLNNALSKLEISDLYSFFAIKSKEYVIGSCRCGGGKNISVTAGTMRTPESEVLDIAVKMCYYDSLESVTPKSINDPITVTRASLLKAGSITHEEGKLLPPLSEIFLSTLVNNLNNFFKLVNRRSFEEFRVIASGDVITGLSISRIQKSDDFRIEIFKYE